MSVGGEIGVVVIVSASSASSEQEHFHGISQKTKKKIEFSNIQEYIRLLMRNK